MSQFFDADITLLWAEVVALMRDPYSNMTAALLLLGAVVIVALMLASVVIAIVVGLSSKSRRAREQQELEELQELMALLGDTTDEDMAALAAARPAQREPYPWLPMLGVGIATALVLAVALGVTTASSTVCTTCHTATPHSTAVRNGVKDPHAKVECVQCHESSGWLGSVTIEVPERLVHYTNGAKKDPGRTAYGAVVSSPCSRCHDGVDRQTTLDEERGVRMAHKQPLEAGAECRDCHKASNGVVSTLTAGMAPCLRCHDGKEQPTDCALCHTKDVGVATTPRTVVNRLEGRKLIDTPDCGSCHNQEKSCDPCHGGQRMPHTDLFMWWGHAREGVKDLWYNDGERCGTCHGEGRRPCSTCHAFSPGHPAAVFRTTHGNVKKDNSACTGCHNPKAYMAGRDFCGMCHNKPYVEQ